MDDPREPTGEPSRPVPSDKRDLFWTGVLNLFPFFFLPIVAMIGVILAMVMPYLTGVADH